MLKNYLTIIVLAFCFSGVKAQLLTLPNGASDIGTNTSGSGLGIGINTPQSALHIYNTTSTITLQSKVPLNYSSHNSNIIFKADGYSNDFSIYRGIYPAYGSGHVEMGFTAYKGIHFMQHVDEIRFGASSWAINPSPYLGPIAPFRFDDLVAMPSLVIGTTYSNPGGMHNFSLPTGFDFGVQKNSYFKGDILIGDEKAPSQSQAAALEINFGGDHSGGNQRTGLRINGAWGAYGLMDGDDFDVYNADMYLMDNSPKHIWMVRAGGNVGIGTSPRVLPETYRLGVGGGLITEKFRADNISIGLTEEGKDKLHLNGGVFRITGTDPVGQSSVGSGLRLGVNSTLYSWIQSADAPLALNPTSGKFVAIGFDPTNPSLTLPSPSLDYKLIVKGKVLCEEVMVKLSGNWPDYVFQPDYKLTPLKEVENFIKINQHLPEVPSAKEVEEGGIKLAEMNKILLEKVEQLTLYLIEQNKKIESLESQFEKLNK